MGNCAKYFTLDLLSLNCEGEDTSSSPQSCCTSAFMACTLLYAFNTRSHKVWTDPNRPDAMEICRFVRSVPWCFVHPHLSSMLCRHPRTLSSTAEIRAANERSLLITQQQLSSSAALKSTLGGKKKKKFCQGNTTPACLVAQKPEEKQRASKHSDACLVCCRSCLNIDVKTLTFT